MWFPDVTIFSEASSSNPNGTNSAVQCTCGELTAKSDSLHQIKALLSVWEPLGGACSI